MHPLMIKLNLLYLRNDQQISLFVKPNIIDGNDSLGNSVKKKIVGIKLSLSNTEFAKKDP